MVWRIVSVLAVLMFLGAWGAGCQRRVVDDGVDAWPNVAMQAYELEEVEGLLGTVEVGMDRGEVMIRLGSPAQRLEDAWVYVEDHEGMFVPARALVIRFREDRYVGYEYETIVLGERLGDESGAAGSEKAK